MMKLFISALLLLFLSPDISEEEKIIWDENRKLTWADFKGVPSGPLDFVASTNSGVSFSFSYKERNGVGTIDYTVLSNFYPVLSWYRPSKVSAYILEHEQMHFDISELCARKLRKSLSNVPRNRNFKENTEVIYQENEAYRRELQTRYDIESDHSNNKEEEYKWRVYIAEQLEVYGSWK
ncbi:MAG: DUF922 domain-containing protein [Flavobacteriaceae bacterium]|nr:DUF922 domain-containing protein [Flavobacteriaceae bacterium]